MLYSQKEPVSLKEYLAQKPKWIWCVIVLLLLTGFSLSGFGVYQVFSATESEVVSSNDVQAQVCERSDDFGQMTVYISGAVQQPGVYILEADDRVTDLVTAAGGFTQTADSVYVNKQFNLAKRVSDGEQFYVPTVDEQVQQLEQPVDSSNQTDVTVEPLQGPISINSSTKAQLMELSGIGEARATKIIENRPYTSASELVERDILSESIFKEIESEISI